MSDTIQFTVTGMTCGGCENAVKMALGRMAGVEAVAASHASNRVEVKADTTRVTRAILQERIEALGYTVR